MSKRLTIGTLSVVVLLLATVALYRRMGAPGGLTEFDSGPVMLMGTFGRIQLRCQGQELADEALAGALRKLEEIDEIMSTYRDDSEISRVNREADKHPVGVSGQLYGMLAEAVRYSRLTDGAFDVTVEPLLALWSTAAQENRRPSEDELRHRRQMVGYEKVVLSDPSLGQVSFTQSGVRVNLNAIAKGHAVDMALEALRQPGVTAALVDIGGEIACFGQPDRGKNWRVGIQDPFAADNDNPLQQQARWVIELRDYAVATSGNYRRYLTIAGKRISHIVDPRTGEPAEALPSVTVIAPRAADADALATAVSVMGEEKGIALIDSLPGVEAFVITGQPGDMQLFRSSGFARYEMP